MVRLFITVTRLVSTLIINSDNIPKINGNGGWRIPHQTITFGLLHITRLVSAFIKNFYDGTFVRCTTYSHIITPWDRVPALRYTPCRAGFGTVRFAFAKAQIFHWINRKYSDIFLLQWNFWSFPLLSKRVMPIFVRIQKRRRSLHLSRWGSRQPLYDKRKRPTPQYGQTTGNETSPFVEIRLKEP